MAAPTITVVGLGPGDPSLLTDGARRALETATVARLRTRVHPTAAQFSDVPSYDHLYDTAEDFEALYVAIVDDLIQLANATEDGSVVYAVPGSPSVAERTVELLVARDDVTVRVLPAVSVIDVACARLGVDPMRVGLRIADALDSARVRGSGPVLVLQVHAPEVAAVLADSLPPNSTIAVLHHLGLDDEVVRWCRVFELAAFPVDHLTSVWVSDARSAGSALDELEALAHRLRRECVWDAEQSTTTLGHHLLEEAYEALDALGAYASDPDQSAHAVEELGDLLYQVVAQTEIASEADDFSLIDVITAITTKLIDRHPHVFDNAVVADAAAAAAQWETIKKSEKSRTSVTDGVPLALPALALYEKMRQRGDEVGLAKDTTTTTVEHVHHQLRALASSSSPDNTDAWNTLARAVGDLAHDAHVDFEAVVRAAALRVRDDVIAHESNVVDRAHPAE